MLVPPLFPGVASTDRFAVESACSQRKDHVSTWLWILIIIVVALAALAYFRRRRAG
jgi:t-SNARE complex subunit (syntaxin)